jgi:hypothetical protein
MEITYDDIIKYLVSKTQKNFVSNNDVCIKSDLFPIEFQNILNDQFYRLGVLQNNFQNLNISFYVSFLTLTVNTFQQNTNEEKMNLIKHFTKFINEQIIEMNLSPKKINLDIIDDNIIQFFSEIFDINILIFDFKNINIFIAFTEDVCNIYKPFILLSNFNEQYEPILYKDTKIMSSNDEYFKKILENSSIKYLNSINKKYVINNNITHILQELSNNNNLINQTFIKNTDIRNIMEDKTNNKTNLVNIQPESNVPETVIPNVIKTSIPDEKSLTQLNKMQKTELLELLTKNNITIENKKILKKDLIKLIQENKYY